MRHGDKLQTSGRKAAVDIIGIIAGQSHRGCGSRTAYSAEIIIRGTPEALSEKSEIQELTFVVNK